MNKITKTLSIALLACSASSLFAATTDVKFFTVAKGDHDKYIGSVQLTDTQYGLLIQPHLNKLTPGIHGFHVHVKPSCADNGMAAGGHLDPSHSDKHLGPYNPNGHLGDLPALTVTDNGEANLSTLAPRLTVKQVEGHSIMIHAGGDNYSDNPAKLGGGGARFACAVVK